MGATEFRVRAEGSTLIDAYRRAKEKAEYEHGHNQYNGTISTTNNVKDVSERYKKEHRDKGTTRDEFIRNTMDETQKWGTCYAIIDLYPTPENHNGTWIIYGWAAE